MSNFAEVIATNPPRLVVLFRYNPNTGVEEFQWGTAGGNIPILNTISAIMRVQADLLSNEWIPECTNPDPALCIVWGAESKTTQHFVHPDIPTDPLVGMLETIKFALIGSRMGQHQASQKIILGIDGKPARM